MADRSSKSTDSTPSESPALLRGTLDMLILRTLDDGPMHGYTIARAIRDQSNDVLRVEEGSLYPALHRLHQRGCITASWGVSESNRKAKFYTLSTAGEKQLRDEVSRWALVSRAISDVLAPAPAAAPTATQCGAVSWAL